MRPIRVSKTGAGSTAVVPIDYRVSPTNVGIGVKVTGTVNYTVEHTFDDIWDAAVTPVWFPNSGLTAQTASKDGNYVVPVTAVRGTVNSGSGTIDLIVIQGDPK